MDNKISENTEVTLDLKTIALVVSFTISIVGLYFTLKKDIELAKELPEPQVTRTESDEDGFIYTAAVNVDEELVEMLEASRQYENNVEMVTTLRGLMMRTISMGK